MNQNRPVNLDLSKFSFPFPALVSITHRIAGVILFVGTIFLLCALDDSLESAQSFAAIKNSMTTGFGSFITWGLLSALAYHFVAGIKHLVMDLGIGEELKSAQIAASLVVAVSGVLIVLAGVWVWA